MLTRHIDGELGVELVEVAAFDAEAGLGGFPKRAIGLGATGEGIARGLNSDGLKTTKGNPWSRDTICHIMRNPVYCGDYFFNKGHYGKYQGIRDGKVAGDCKRGPHDASDMIIHRDHWLPIVDRPLWNRVQKLLDRNGVYKAPVDTFLLSSRVQCGSCEAERPMWGRTMRNGSRVYICEACGATVKESEAAVVAAIADADRTALDLKYTEIRAEIAGRIDRAFITSGNLVTGGLGSGTLLTRICRKQG